MHLVTKEFRKTLLDRVDAEQLIRRIVAICPKRSSASRDELRAQTILWAKLRRLGGLPTWHRFRFNRNLYLVLALHFGLATIGSVLFFVYPPLAAAIHLFVAVSYVADSNRTMYLLRRLVPWARASNLLVTFPAAGQVRRRVVFTAHADAAPTGWLFRPRLGRFGSWFRNAPRIAVLFKPLFIITAGLIAVAAVEIHAWHSGTLRFSGCFYGFTFVFAMGVILNLQIVLTDRTVDGASDNLSGCAALTVLARRLTKSQPDDVEYVFAVTACEEAGTGGGYALARQMRSEWDPAITDILVLDNISGGDLCIFEEGEIIPRRVPRRLLNTAMEVAGGDERFERLFVFPLPAGATDAMPLLAGGYQAMGIGRVDPRLGTPRHYHLPSDTPDNLDYDELMQSIDFVERLAYRLVDADGSSAPQAPVQR